MSARALVTGGAGFVGQWLVRSLLAQGSSVVSFGPKGPAIAILSSDEEKSVEWHQGDIRDDRAIEAAVDAAKPDVIFHLAGITFVPEARSAPANTFDVNLVGTVRLLAAVANRHAKGVLDPTIVLTGSATQYGRHDAGEMPLDEQAKQMPHDVYAATKAAQEIVGLQMHRAEGIRVICTRSFNHSGRGHAEHFLLPALVHRALRLRDTGANALVLGNQDSVRDYLHVEDVVDAYLRLATKGIPGEAYNVCSGDGVSARQLATEVLLRVGTTAEITTDPALVRGVDVPTLVGSPAKLQRATGWRPTRTRADIIDDLIHAATR